MTLLLALLACVADAPAPAGLMAWLDAPGALLVDAPERASELPRDREVVALSEAPGAREALLAGDEQAAATALRGLGVRFLLLRRAAAGGVDRDEAVLSRLYHDDDRRWFALRAVDERSLLYQVLDQPRGLPIPLARAGAARLRARLAGREPAALPPHAGAGWELIASLRRQGEPTLASASCASDEYAACLDALAAALRSQAPGEVAGLILELHRITERAAVLIREEDALASLWEPGVDGVASEAGVIPGAAAYAMDEDRLWRGAVGRLEKLRDIHYLDHPQTGAISLSRGVPPVPMALVDLGVVESSLSLAGEWALVAAESASDPADSALVAVSLALAHRATGRQDLRAGAERALARALAGALTPDGAAAAVAAGAALEGDALTDAAAARLGVVLLEAGSREALVALVLLYERDGDPRWLAPARLALERAGETGWAQTPGAVWPAGTCDDRRADAPLVARVAEAVHRATGDPAAAALGLEAARWLIEACAWTPERAPWPDYAGGYYQPGGAPPGALAFRQSQAAAAAYALALRHRPDQAPFFLESAMASARFALQLQYDDAQLYPFPAPDALRGAVRAGLTDASVHPEQVASAVAALEGTLAAARADPGLPDYIRLSPLRNLLMDVGRGPERAQ